MAINQINIKIIDKFENDRVLQVEQTQKSAPVLTYNGADDKYQPIMASEFTANLLVSDKSDGKFFHLYTGNEKRYYCLVEDQDNNKIWDGYLLPDFYSEPYTNNAFFVEFTATDGLGLLKGKYLPNEYYKKETSVIKLIAECLKFTKLDKPIYFSPAIESAVTDYRWDEIAVNGKQYLDDPDAEWRFIFWQGEVPPKRKNAYEILELLLKSIGCTLYCQGEYWYVEGINRKHETSQLNQLFTKEGVYVENQTLTKSVNDLVYLSEPTISVVSPWRIVDVVWDCDEDGALIPEWALEEKEDELFQPHKNDLFDFWEAHGEMNVNAVSKELDFEYQYFGYSIPILVLTGNKKPRSLDVLYKINLDAGYNANGINPDDLPSNFIDIKTNKYLKVSDEYITRSIDYDLKVKTDFRLDGSGNVIADGVDVSYFSAYYRYDMTIGNTIVLSTNLPETDEKNKRLKFTKSDRAADVPEDIENLDYVTVIPASLKGDLKQEELGVPNNGFFNYKLFPPLSSDYTNPWYFRYVVQELKIEITALKTWNHVLERDIDFSTVYDLEIFHGDSIADLTEKQWRFRRPIYTSDLGGAVEVLEFSTPNTLQPWMYYLMISYTDYLLISENPELFYVTYGGEDILMNDLVAGAATGWQLHGPTFGGSYYVIVDSSIITHSSGIGSDISDFSTLFVADSDDYFVGYEPEDNEWRESWKRYGETESIRYGVALGKIYHNAQYEGLPVIEGTALQLIFPRDLGQFQWMDVRQFIPTRLTINFNEGKTDLYVIDSKYEEVEDYL